MATAQSSQSVNTANSPHVQTIKARPNAMDPDTLPQQRLLVSIEVQAPAAAIVALQHDPSALPKKQPVFNMFGAYRHRHGLHQYRAMFTWRRDGGGA